MLRNVDVLPFHVLSRHDQLLGPKQPPLNHQPRCSTAHNSGGIEIVVLPLASIIFGEWHALDSASAMSTWQELGKHEQLRSGCCGSAGAECAGCQGGRCHQCRLRPVQQQRLGTQYRADDHREGDTHLVSTATLKILN